MAQDQIVLSEAGQEQFIQWLLNTTISGVLDYQLMLFSNEIDPDCQVEFADLVESTFPGYARFTLNRGSWQPPTTVDCCTVSLYGSVPLSWTNTGSSALVAGYAILLPPGDTLIAVQALSLPLTLPPFGTLTLRPQFTLRAGACGSP